MASRETKPKLSHTYGRGKFNADQKYVKYMSMIVDHASYAGMPNARSEGGRINWQVSSGKSTSFYKDYLARRDWWVRKADSLALPGKGQENDRFTIAARLIHPTGYRVCRLCGDSFNVGYFYLNSISAKRFGKQFPGLAFNKGDAIDQVLGILGQANSKAVEAYFFEEFPERTAHFQTYGVSKEAFERSNYLRSSKLSPGFMGNPPDRLDGFHDYHAACRKANDPGRSDENMRSYNHDRRSFEWWAEGNWALADALYNLAGTGVCTIEGCGKVLRKVSPDHIGPLACGFKQLPLFAPTCTNHNSAKNRRFSLTDINRLIAYEEQTGESAASWQVRAHWDKYKNLIRDDEDAKALSNSLRSLQDMYLRVLHALHSAGKTRFIATLLKPEYALQEFSFSGLDAGALTFESVAVSQNSSNLRRGFCARTVRIAVDSLSEYSSKTIDQRKMVRADHDDNERTIAAALEAIIATQSAGDEEWAKVFKQELSNELRENQILALLLDNSVPKCDTDENNRARLVDLFDSIGQDASIDFGRYK